MPQEFLLRYKTMAEAVNPKFSAVNIAKTAQEFRDLESRGRQYEFGDWAPTQSLNEEEWGGKSAKEAWRQSVDDVPLPVRRAMTALIRGNLLFSSDPIPMMFDVGLGADHTIRVDSGIDNSVSPPVPAMKITLICKS
jgi:hypothetical protein